MQQTEMKPSGVMAAIMQPSFIGSLLSSCEGFMTSAVPLDMAVPTYTYPLVYKTMC